MYVCYISCSQISNIVLNREKENMAIINYFDIAGLEGYVFPDELRRKELIVGIDPGLGITQNSLTGIEFIDLYSAEQILEYEGNLNHFQTTELLKKILENSGAIIKYIVIENNSFGKLFIDEIQKDLPELEFFSSDEKRPGFKTTKYSKELLIFSFVFQILEDNPDILKSRRLYAQLQSLYVDKNNKIKSEFRTDLIMAFGLAQIGRYDYILNKMSKEELSKLIYIPSDIKEKIENYEPEEDILIQKLNFLEKHSFNSNLLFDLEHIIYQKEFSKNLFTNIKEKGDTL